MVMPPSSCPQISAEEERQFYDDEYRRCLAFSDERLAWNADLLRASFKDPMHPFWERRTLFRVALQALLAEPLRGRKVLDYGCGTGDWGVLLATEGARVTLLDLSPIAIEVGIRRARASGVADSVRGVARDACDLSCFAAGEFDLVFANAALHHTIKYPNALDELVRVIRPGGTLILAETFGNNPVLNLARRARAWVAREPVEQGEGVVLDDGDLALLGQSFGVVEISPLNLLAMTKRLFRGRYESFAVRALLSVLGATDAVILRVMPSLERYCGEVVVVARR